MHSTGMAGLALEQTFPDGEFDTLFQDFLSEGAEPSTDALGEPLATDFSWPSDKLPDEFPGSDTVGVRPSTSGSPLPPAASSDGILSLRAPSPTSDPTCLDGVLPIRDVTQLPGPAPPAATPSRSHSPLSADSGAGTPVVLPQDAKDASADPGLGPPEETLIRASADNGATPSHLQEAVDAGSAQSHAALTWQVAPHMQQQAPHELAASGVPTNPFTFSGGMHPAMKSGAASAPFSSTGMASAQQPRIDFSACVHPPDALAGSMWMGGSAPGSWPQSGPFLQPSNCGQKEIGDAASGWGGSVQSGHLSSGSGNSSQSAFTHPALSPQQQQQQSLRQPSAPPSEETTPQASPQRWPQQSAPPVLVQDKDQDQLLLDQHQQQQQQQQAAPPHATRPRSQRRAAVKRDAPMAPQSPPPMVPAQAAAAASQAFGLPMPPAMYGPGPHNGVYGMPAMGPQQMGAFGMNGFGRMPPLAGSMPNSMGIVSPQQGFMAMGPPQEQEALRSTSRKSYEGQSPRGAYSAPGTPRSEALVLEELKQLISQLDPATKSTMKASLYRISRNAQGSTGAEESGAKAARAAAAAQKPGANDAIGPVDRMVADLLYKEPVQQAPDLPRALAETARAQQARSS